jgi:hypothetical protein
MIMLRVAQIYYLSEHAHKTGLKGMTARFVRLRIITYILTCSVSLSEELWSLASEDSILKIGIL